MKSRNPNHVKLCELLAILCWTMGCPRITLSPLDAYLIPETVDLDLPPLVDSTFLLDPPLPCVLVSYLLFVWMVYWSFSSCVYCELCPFSRSSWWRGGCVAQACLATPEAATAVVLISIKGLWHTCQASQFSQESPVFHRPFTVLPVSQLFPLFLPVYHKCTHHINPFCDNLFVTLYSMC